VPNFICQTFGVEYGPRPQPPEACLICDDERQYVPATGQAWTTREAMQGHYRNRFRALEAGLWEIWTQPRFGIGQRALLVQTAHGNLLWDCLGHLDQATVAKVERLGGLSVIAISHPHFYASCCDWSEAFGAVPVVLPEVDRRHLMYPHPNVRHFTADEIEPLPGLRLLRLGGHFEGSAVLHWAEPAGGGGVGNWWRRSGR